MKLLLLVLLVLAGACASDPPKPAAAVPATTALGQAQMSLLAIHFVGTWQAPPEQVGPPKEKLRVARFWKDLPAERWLYLEYEHIGEAKPYRQVIYRLTEARGIVFATPQEFRGDASRFAGEWAKPEPFAHLGPGDLRPRPDCAVAFTTQYEVIFNGAIRGTGCRSANPAVHHEHEEFYITSATMRTWAVGQDASGKRVAGPIEPYEFRKILQIPG
jgi:hypothetical protein